jgi:hypothetical protein
MNHSVKRTSKHSAANANGLPTVDDAVLVELVIGLPIGDTLRAELAEVAAKLVPRKFGQIKRPLRDRLLKLAAGAGVLPGMKPPTKKVATYLNATTYEERSVKGTDFAQRLLYDETGKPKPIPAPIRRRTA